MRTSFPNISENYLLPHFSRFYLLKEQRKFANKTEKNPKWIPVASEQHRRKPRLTELRARYMAYNSLLCINKVRVLFLFT